MRTSAALVVVGTAFVVAQLVWPLRLDPNAWVSMGLVFLGLLAVATGVALGLIAGTALYRTAVLIGSLGIAVMLFGLTARLHARPDVPVPSPTENELVFGFGLAVFAASWFLGGFAIRRASRRSRPMAP